MLYFFHLGNTPDLSLAELKSIYPKQEFSSISANLYFSSFSEEFNSEEEIKKFGGIIKIGKITDIIKDKNLLRKKIISLLEKFKKVNKIFFGISRYEKVPIGSIKSLSEEIKKELIAKKYKVRYLLPTEKEIISSVQIANYRLLDIVTTKYLDDIYIGFTQAIQDFRDWGKRDYQRPFANPSAGMLPPKIARMMVNLVLNNNQTSNPLVILDPFCGVGTVGAEALLRGAWTIISDLDRKQIEKAQKNLVWICNTYGISVENFAFYQENSTKISTILKNNQIDGIVTEPYLGPPVNYFKNKPMLNDRPFTEGRILHTFIELENLYLESFNDWKKVLKPNAKVAIIFPSYSLGGNEYFMKNIIDSCEKLGYNKLDGPIQYGHPQSILKRNIYLFQLINS